MSERILNIFDQNSTIVDISKQMSLLRKGPSNKLQKLSIGILANFSTQFLVKGLQVVLESSGYDPTIIESGFNQWELELQNEKSTLYKSALDVTIIALSSKELILNPATSNPTKFTCYIKELILKYKSKSSSKVLVVMPETLGEGLDQTSVFAVEIDVLRKNFQEHLADVALLVDLNPLILSFGISKWHATKYYINGSFNCHPNCYPAFANYLCHFIINYLKRSIKLVITDLDNTLWKGVVGEVGAESVDLDRNGGGYPHLLLQKHLLDLKNKGVLLAICSKNDPEVVEEVFRIRDEMILKLDDFIEAQINWHPKSNNVKTILKNLNLTESGVVFIDDQVFERQEVKSMLPEIFVPEMPDDPTFWGHYFASEGVFRICQTSTEDKVKFKKYKEESIRKQEESKFESYEDFLKNLELQIKPQKIDESNIDRVFELIQKTNQFNLRTKRYSKNDLIKIVSKNENFCFCYNLKDKYGDYGVIAVFVADRVNSREYFIDTFLMSCRVMGRNVENAIFGHFLSFCKKVSINTISGEYIPTPKNKPVESLLTSLGFDQSDQFKYSYILTKNISPVLNHIQFVE